jgi:signal peptidase I
MNEHGITAPSSESFVTAWAEGEARAERCRQRQQRRRLVRGTREVLTTMVLAVVIFLGTHSAVQGREVEGPSMQPNYHAGQRLFINKLLYTRINAGKLLPFVDDSVGSRYLLHGPRRGEVIVFRAQTKGQDDIIKRVIGVPGDRVTVRDGNVYVNDRELDETYLPYDATLCSGRWCDVTLGKDEYYVLGDNRRNSSDSRLWGPLRSERIVGKAWFIFSPLRDLGRAP